MSKLAECNKKAIYDYIKFNRDSYYPKHINHISTTLIVFVSLINFMSLTAWRLTNQSPKRVIMILKVPCQESVYSRNVFHPYITLKNPFTKSKIQKKTFKKKLKILARSRASPPYKKVQFGPLIVGILERFLDTWESSSRPNFCPNKNFQKSIFKPVTAISFFKFLNYFSRSLFQFWSSKIVKVKRHFWNKPILDRGPLKLIKCKIGC